MLKTITRVTPINALLISSTNGHYSSNDYAYHTITHSIESTLHHPIRMLEDTVDINTPESTRMSIVGAQPLAIEGIPHSRRCIFCDTEQQVAIAVILDLSDGTLMTVQH